MKEPWWKTSLVWDGVTTGGAGMTAPVFYGIGSGSLQANGSATKRTVIAGGLLVGGSVVGGLLGYGLYGHLRDQGWGPWKSGAMTGLLGGVATAGVLTVMSLITGRPLVPPLKEYNGGESLNGHG